MSGGVSDNKIGERTMDNEKGIDVARQVTAKEPGTTKPKYACIKYMTVEVTDKNQPFNLGTLTLNSPDGPEANVQQLKQAIIEAAVQICRAIDATSPGEKE